MSHWSLTLSASPVSTASNVRDEDYAALDDLAGGKPLRHRYRINCLTTAVVTQVLNDAHASGATVADLHLAGYGEHHEIRVHLTGIGSAEARELSDRFYGLEGVTACQVEHQWT